MNNKSSRNQFNFEEAQGMSLADTSRYIKKSLKVVFPTIKFSVTSRCPYGIYIRFTETPEVSKQDVINIVGMFSKHTNETLRLNDSIIYYSDTDTYKKEQRIKYEQQKKELKAEQEACKKLYNENVKVDGIHNAKITKVEDKDIFVTALEPSINKNDWKVDNDKYIDEKSYTTKYKITDIVELNEEEYNYFCFNLLNDYDFLDNKGGSCVDDDTEKLLYNYAVAITCKGKETLIVDPQGYSYARYTARLVKDIDNKLEEELKRINNKPNPEPPKPTKKDAVELPELDSTTDTKNTQNGNVVAVDFTKRTVKVSNAIWEQHTATNKQLWALHCITKLNTTNLQITKGEASLLISKSKKGTNIIAEVQQLLNKQQLLRA